MSSATFDEIVPVAVPDASVTTAGCVIVLPVPVANSTTAAPETGLLYWSRAVTVTVVTSVPLAITVAGTTPIVETARSTSPAVNVTSTVGVSASAPIVALIVFVSATVDTIVPLASPLIFVFTAGCVIVCPRPVASSTTAAPGTGFPNSSLTVTVMLISSISSATADAKSVSIEEIDISAAA